MLDFELELDFSINSQFKIKNSKLVFCITPEEYAAHSTGQAQKLGKSRHFGMGLPLYMLISASLVK